MADLSLLQTKMHYQFQRLELLELALTHSSWAQENAEQAPVYDNERLEFLGDAVLDLAISNLLYAKFPDADEGALSKMRASVVNESRLAMMARELGVPGALKLGKGEAKIGGADKDSILACAMEALLGAVSLDSGFQRAEQVVAEIFADFLKNETLFSINEDYKSRLQELTQARWKSMPVYKLRDTEGPDHDKRFTVEILINGQARGMGIGRSKKEAEQQAAEKAYQELLSTNGGNNESES